MTRSSQTRIDRRTLLRGAAAAALTTATTGLAAAKGDPQRGNDGNHGNGPKVTGMYKAVFAYDADGGWYGWNLSDRHLESGTVASIAALDQATLTTCYYEVQYAGSFGDDPYLDYGWIANHVVCAGYEPDNRNVLFVSESDPRYTGDGPSIWGSWEYHVDAQRGKGNVLVTDEVRPHSP